MGKRTVLVVATSLLLAACGGGGGGGSSTLAPYVRQEVPYHTPVKVHTFQPLAGAGTAYAITEIYARDLNGNGVDEVVIAGRKSQPSTTAEWQNFNMQIYGWNTGSFTSETSTWFAGNDNVIIGSEPSVKFADFNGDGKLDMSVAHSTDMEFYGPASIFLNNGTRFTRTNLNLGNTWSHDSAVGDLNNDGYADLLVTDYGGKPAIAFGSARGTFTIAKGTSQPGASGASIADYLGNNTKTIIFTDAPSTGNQDTKLYSWSVSGDALTLTEIAVLPASRFYLSKWDNVRAATNLAPHEIRNLAMDFDRDGKTDVIVFATMPRAGNVHEYSEVQFLKNKGGGTFEDVTDSVLRDYNTTRSTTYNPIIIDINNDGLDDLLLSSTDYTSDIGTTALIATKEGIFVEKYTSVFKDFQTQIDSNNSIGIVKGPDGINYLISTTRVEEGGSAKLAVYLARIGSFGTVTAPASIATLQEAWPWMSAPEANKILASTALRNFLGYDESLHGHGIIDLDAALRPIGGLGISFDGRTGKRLPISGHLAIPNYKGHGLNSVVALDGLGRNFLVDMSVLSGEARPLNVSYSHQAEDSQSWSMRFLGYTFDWDKGLSAVGDNQNFATGITSKYWGWDSPYKLFIGAARMQGSPWLSFSGIFGTLRSSTVLETNLTRSWENGFWAQAGVQQTSTDFQVGLVEDISPLWSAYVAGGWRDESWSVFSGLQPTIFNGHIKIRLPHSVDRQGILHYKNQTHEIRTDHVMFAGLDKRFGNKIHMLTLGVVANTESQFSARAQYRVNF